MTDELGLSPLPWSGLLLCDASTHLVPDAHAPGEARRLVRQLCGDAGVNEGVSDVVVLLTSETVTNSVLHGRGRVRVHAETDSGRIRVEVGDNSRRHPVASSTDNSSE